MDNGTGEAANSSVDNGTGDQTHRLAKISSGNAHGKQREATGSKGVPQASQARPARPARPASEARRPDRTAGPGTGQTAGRTAGQPDPQEIA